MIQSLYIGGIREILFQELIGEEKAVGDFFCGVLSIQKHAAPGIQAVSIRFSPQTQLIAANDKLGDVLILISRLR